MFSLLLEGTVAPLYTMYIGKGADQLQAGHLVREQRGKTHICADNSKFHYNPRVNGSCNGELCCEEGGPTSSLAWKTRRELPG